MKNVTVYSTPTCPFCKQVKEYLSENDIEFTDVDVSQDAAAAEAMVQKTGQMGVPVTVIGSGSDEQVIIGFDKKAIGEALGLS